MRNPLRTFPSPCWMWPAVLILFSQVQANVGRAAAEEQAEVAGRSLAAWSDDLKSDNEIARARAAKTLVAAFLV